MCIYLLHELACQKHLRKRPAEALYRWVKRKRVFQLAEPLVVREHIYCNLGIRFKINCLKIQDKRSHYQGKSFFFFCCLSFSENEINLPSSSTLIVVLTLMLRPTDLKSIKSSPPDILLVISPDKISLAILVTIASVWTGYCP